MKKIQHLITQVEFHMLLAVLSVLVVSWPVLSTPEHQQPENMFVYLFLPWAILILLLLLISRSYARDVSQEHEEHDHDT